MGTHPAELEHFSAPFAIHDVIFELRPWLLHYSVNDTLVEAKLEEVQCNVDASVQESVLVLLSLDLVFLT